DDSQALRPSRGRSFCPVSTTSILSSGWYTTLMARSRSVPIFAFLRKSGPPCMPIALMSPWEAMSRRNRKMDVKLDFPAALEPITILNRVSSTSMKEKLLKFSTWIRSIGIHIPCVIVILKEKEGIGRPVPNPHKSNYCHRQAVLCCGGVRNLIGEGRGKI